MNYILYRAHGRTGGKLSGGGVSGTDDQLEDASSDIELESDAGNIELETDP